MWKQSWFTLWLAGTQRQEGGLFTASLFPSRVHPPKDLRLGLNSENLHHFQFFQAGDYPLTPRLLATIRIETLVPCHQQRVGTSNTEIFKMHSPQKQSWSYKNDYDVVLTLEMLAPVGV